MNGKRLKQELRMFFDKGLEWFPLITDDCILAVVGDEKDGASFYLSCHPTCYRRGPWKLVVDVHGGEHHHKWGCFDEQDQPIRWYHHKDSALREAHAIATVLLGDRMRTEEFHEHKKERLVEGDC